MSGMELTVEPASERFDPTDDRWLDQVTGLVTELRRAVGDVSTTRVPVAGTKGTLESIVVSLASAGSMATMVELVKSWLSRDRTRSLKVTWGSGGDVQAVELSGAGWDDTAFDGLLRAVAKQAGDAG